MFINDENLFERILNLTITEAVYSENYVQIHSGDEFYLDIAIPNLIITPENKSVNDLIGQHFVQVNEEPEKTLTLFSSNGIKLEICLQQVADVSSYDDNTIYEVSGSVFPIGQGRQAPTIYVYMFD